MTKLLSETSNQIRIMRDENKHLLGLQTRHQETIVSSTRRVFKWSVFQIMLILGVSGFQILYLLSFFQKSSSKIRI